MRYMIILDTVWDVLYKGSKRDCKKVLSAFQRYNNANNIKMISEDEFNGKYIRSKYEDSDNNRV